VSRLRRDGLLKRFYVQGGTLDCNEGVRSRVCRFIGGSAGGGVGIE